MTPRTILSSGFDHNNQRLSLKFSFDLTRGNHKTVHGYLSKGQFYEPDISQFLLRVLKHGDTAVDIGGNLGAHSLLMSKLVGKNGKVISFEPDPVNVADFKINVALSKVENITLHETALSSSKAEVSLFSSKCDGGWTAVATGATESFTQDVTVNCKENYNVLGSIPSDRLDHIVGDRKVKVVKIDVEGYEGKVLDGATAMMKSEAVDYWIVEYAAHCLDHFCEDQWSIRKRFYAHGYDCFVLPMTGALPLYIPRETKINVATIINLLFAKADRIGRDFAEANVTQYAFATNTGA